MEDMHPLVAQMVDPVWAGGRGIGRPPVTLAHDGSSG
jgi:hypothetical protein